jgi:hypothetical protein
VRMNDSPALLVILMLAVPFCAAQYQPVRQSGAITHPAPAAIRPQPAERALPPGSADHIRNAPIVHAVRPHQIIRGQGPHNGDWLRNTMQLSPQEQQKRLEQDQHFRQLPPQRQEQLRNRLQTFNTLSPDQKQRLLNRMEMIEHLRPEQQQQARQLFGQFRTMDPQRKDMMRRTLREMRTMPPDARERLLNSPELRARYTPQEIQMLHGFNDIGFAAPEQ